MGNTHKQKSPPVFICQSAYNCPKMNLKQWKTFFLEAGILSGDAATYANKFVENRIQAAIMLVHLNKDYLRWGLPSLVTLWRLLRPPKAAHEDYLDSQMNEEKESQVVTEAIRMYVLDCRIKRMEKMGCRNIYTREKLHRIKRDYLPWPARK